MHQPAHFRHVYGILNVEYENFRVKGPLIHSQLSSLGHHLMMKTFQHFPQ